MPDRAILFIDQLPVSAFDEHGVSLHIGSGEFVRRERWPRSLWRKHLETEMRKLNEWEIAERADRGRVIAMERRRGH